MSNRDTDICMCCGSTSHHVIHTEIREEFHNVMMCNDCNFIFLQNYQAINYLVDYNSLTCDNEWSTEDKLIKRSESLKRFNRVVSSLILDKNNCNVLEIGAGNGASIDVLNEIDEIATEDCKVYFSLPNFNDFYSHTLSGKEKDKYLTFNFHLAHPYYYTIETFSNLIERGGGWKISSIQTVQDYSIVNYFNWYINGERSKNIESGTKVNKSIEQLNNAFIDIIEKTNKGNNISVILEKRNY